MVRLEPFFKWWTSTSITVLPKLACYGDKVRSGWTTAWFAVLPKRMERPALICKGELLPGLRYIQNLIPISREILSVNYCLIYGTSETRKSTEARSCLVNYYLDYGTSETTPASRVRTSSVNYCLIYGTSETCASQRPFDSQVNYYLDYRTSETEQ